MSDHIPENSDTIENEIRASLKQNVATTVSQLDKRMALHFGQPRKEQRFSWLSMPVLQPVMALGAVAVVLGIGFFWGKQQTNFSGVVSLNSQSPILVATSDSPGFESLYDTLTGKKDLKSWYAQSLAPSSEPLSEETSIASGPQSASTNTDTESELKSDADDGTAEAEAEAAAPPSSEDAAGAAISMAAPQRQSVSAITNVELLLTGLLTAQVASVGVLLGDLISPVENAVVRLKSSGERELLASDIRSPKGVAVSEAGQVFVTEFQPNGALLVVDDLGEVSLIKSGLVYPAGIAFARDQSLYLAEQGRGRVLKFHTVNGSITSESKIEVFSSGFSGMLTADSFENLPTQSGPFALAITQDNQLLVSDFVSGKNIIYRFSLEQSGNFWDWLFNDS